MTERSPVLLQPRAKVRNLREFLALKNFNNFGKKEEENECKRIQYCSPKQYVVNSVETPSITD